MLRFLISAAVLAAAQTEIALTSDRVLQRGEALLGRFNTNSASSPYHPPG